MSVRESECEGLGLSENERVREGVLCDVSGISQAGLLATLPSPDCSSTSPCLAPGFSCQFDPSTA